MARKKIAILGGGIAALSAAFELTEQDPDNELFDITVYTIGWRLGGKGAVGRRDAKAGYRGEEHGLHVWTGFYDNAFDLVDRVYAALTKQGKQPPFGNREDAFIGLDHCVLMEPADLDAKPDPRADWNSCTIQLAEHEGLPGTPRDSFFSLTDFLRSLLDSSAEQMERVRKLVPDTWSDTDRPLWVTDTEWKAGPFKAAHTRIKSLPSDPMAVTRRQSEELQAMLRSAAEPIKKARLSTEDDGSIRVILSEIAIAIAIGMLRDEVIWNGFDCIDDLEWKEWMGQNGCSEETLKSAIVRGCYDYVFGFIHGQTDVGAGTGTRILLKLMFAYRGSFFYLLRATMGELIFAPLYQVLCDRKVKFNFFTRVDSIRLSADGQSIQSIDTTLQARPEKSTYDPLIEIPDGKGGLVPSWPSEPIYCRLQNGDQLRGMDLESAWSPPLPGACQHTLNLGSDFDEVVLGISIGAFSTICADLINRMPRWKQMTDAVKTTATTAFQAWTTKATRELGGMVPQTVLSGFQLPFDSWGDLSLMLPMEQWPADNHPEGLAYFVGCLDDDTPPSSNFGYPAAALAKAKAATLDWVNKYLRRLWPNVVDEQDHVQWDLFFDPEGRSGDKRLDAQYVRVNINPSDRYVLSVKGSVSARMRADESGVDNLYLAGDWVRTGINAGCIEASVMAGRAAAAAIAGVSLTMPNSTDFDANDLPTQLIPLLDIARKLGSKAFAGTGEIEAYCVLLPLPFEFVQKKLPDGLKLNVSTAKEPPASWEVVFIFARQRNVRPGPLPFGGADYFEIAELIPDVVHSDTPQFQTAVFSYMPHLLVDSLPATLIGQQFYGFNKQLARITVDGGAFSARSPIGNVRAGFERVGVPGDISDFGRISGLRRKLEQPLVGVKKDGNFAYSVLNFGLNAAVFQLIEGTVSIGAPFVPAQEIYDIEKDDGEEGDGHPWGFRFLSRWTLSLPFDGPGGKTSATRTNMSKVTGEYGKAMLGRFLPPRG